jgi:hypothetical protein
MSTVQVEIFTPPPTEPRVKITADLTLREAAILRSLVGTSNGSALTTLWNALNLSSEVQEEYARLPMLPGLVDILPLERAP